MKIRRCPCGREPILAHYQGHLNWIGCPCRSIRPVGCRGYRDNLISRWNRSAFWGGTGGALLTMGIILAALYVLGFAFAYVAWGAL